MKQKIVMRVQMHCQKCRTKALKHAAKADGVSSVGLEGEEKDEVVVIGDGVDAVELVVALRNNVGHTDLITVSVLK